MPGRKVFLRVGRLAHPYYREQIRIVPEGFEYVPDNPDLVDLEGVKRDVASAGTLAHAGRGFMTRSAVIATTRAGLVFRRRIDVPRGVALIHSAQALLRDPQVPYVVDCEDGHVFVFYQAGALSRPWARRTLARRILADECRMVMPWTETAREGFLNALGDSATAELRAKIRTVRPAIEPRVETPARRGTAPLRVLFVGTSFYGKGGVETLRAFERVRSQHEVELDLVTLLPSELRARVEAMPGVTLHEKLTLRETGELYARADVFLFPAHVDTFGWVVLEALSYGLPVLASAHFSLPELVEDGVSGVIFPAENSLFTERRVPRYPWFNPTSYPRSFRAALADPGASYVEGIVAAIAKVAADRSRLEHLAEGALARVTSGPLSPERRRQELGDVYRTAIA